MGGGVGLSREEGCCKEKRRGTGPQTLIGRKRELAAIASALELAAAGRGQIVSVSGEPGIGKTRLALELPRLVRRQGGALLWGQCTAGGEYSPWLRILKQSGGDAAGWLEDGLAGLSARGQVQVRRGAAWADRVRVFENTTAYLNDLARSGPLLLVLDDLHAADSSSLALFGHLSTRLDDLPILALVTYRDGEARRTPGLKDLLAATPMAGALSLRLGGFAREEIRELIDSATGREPSEEAVDSIARLTGGNPLFIELLLKSDALRSGRAQPSDAIRCGVQQHLAPLSATARDVLAAASVIGNEFDLTVVRSICNVEAEQLLDCVAEAEEIGLLTRSGLPPGRYQFSHALVREALYSDVMGAKRARLHGRVAKALEAVSAGDRRSLETIAEHFFCAAALGEASQALDYCERAGQQAAAALDFEASIRFCGMALSAASLASPGDDCRRARLLVALAKAQRRTGRAEARESFALAAKLAKDQGNHGLRAQALLGWAHRRMSARGFPDQEIVAALRDSLAEMPQGDSAARARLMIRLASELVALPQAAEERNAVLEQGTAMARRLGDRDALFAALRHRHFLLLGADTLGERLAIADDMLRVALDARSNENCCKALLYRYADLIAAGDLRRADCEAATILATAADRSAPWFGFAADCCGAMRGAVVGRFGEAACCAERALAFARKLGRSEFEDFYWPAMLVPFEEAGRLSELDEIARKAIKEGRSPALYRAMRARIKLGMGEIATASEIFEDLAASGFDNLERDNSLGICLALLSEICVGLGDRTRAGLLQERLELYRGVNVTFGPLSFFGPASLYLGMLAHTMGRFDAAIGHLSQAAGMARAMGAHAWVAYAELSHAQALWKRREPGDRERALELAASARKIAGALGIRNFESRVEEFIHAVQSQGIVPEAEDRPPKEKQVRPHGGPGRAPVGNSAGVRDVPHGLPCDAAAHPAPGRKVFRREGDYWTILYEGKVLRLKNSKGLCYIAQLLRYPGRDLYVLELAGTDGSLMNPGISGGDLRRLRKKSNASGDGAPLLDQTAKAEYKTRLIELREELEQARSCNDLGRVARLEQETEFLSRELVRAFGLKERGRRWPSEAEHARVNTSNAIRSVLKKITLEHERLGRYLVGCIKTGYFCSFIPDPRFPGDWEL